MRMTNCSIMWMCVVVALFAQPTLAQRNKKADLVKSAARAPGMPRGIACEGDAARLMFPLDASYVLVDFFGDGCTGSDCAEGTDQHNDDDSAEVALGFVFDLYGDEFDVGFVNNNGNISFGMLFSTFTAEGFPIAGFPMVAPFWGDVDTGNPDNVLGDVWMKLYDSNADKADDTLIVTWDNVGYFDEHGDLRNTFQVAISDGTNLEMGLGNNVCFSWDDMCWTTGDASGGEGGFGGTPATVGANRGDGLEFFQIGRFDHEGVDYDGPFGSNDGVSFLDSSSTCFSTAVLTNIAPIPQGFPNKITIDAALGEILDTQVQFISPEAGQTVTVAVTDPNGAQEAGLVITSDSPNVEVVSIDLDWTPGCADAGTYVLEFTASDDFDPPGVTTAILEINVVCSVVGACCVEGDCLGVLSGEACLKEGGSFFEGNECGVCSRGPSEPCEHCGGSEHWVDDPACPVGVDRLELSGAKFGLDFDVESNECVADVSVRAHGPTWINFSGPLDDSSRFPGTRDSDGHFDVRDTEIVSMNLVSVDGLVRMTAGWGRGAIPLPPSYGAIAEQPAEPALADSFFDVTVEIEVVNENNQVIGRLYNQEPVRVESKIDCIPPDANYIHPTGCIPLYTSPIPGEGEHVANLVSAEHRTFEAACFETIGGGIYTDCDSPLTSGEEGVEVTVAGPEGVFNAVTVGPSGVWSIADVPCGEYTVTPHQVFREYCHVGIGGNCPPEPCDNSTVIDVNAANREQNLSIQFLGQDDCIRNDMNYDELCTIVNDVDLFVQCVFDGDCVGPDGRDLLCPADCNCDGLATIVFDVNCFVHDVFVKGECGSCDEPDAKSRTQDGRRSGFTVGGAVYDDARNPMFSGVKGVKVRILGEDRRVVATAATAGPSGIWRVDDLPEGDYTVVIARRGGRVAAGRDVIPITVNAENEAANLSIAVLRVSSPTRSGGVRPDPGQPSE